MNELFFILHVLLVVLFLLLALKGGKSALTTYIVLLAVIANIFVVKQVSLFSLAVTAADVYVIGAILGLNFLQERFGKKAAQSAVYVTLGAFLFFLFMVKMHLLYIPNAFDNTQESFGRIFGFSSRIFIVSIAVVYGVQWFSVFFFSLLKKAFAEKYFHLRQFIVLFFSQCLDSVFFSLVGLWGVVENLWHVMLFSFCIKMIVVVLSSFFVKIAIPQRIIEPTGE